MLICCARCNFLTKEMRIAYYISYQYSKRLGSAIKADFAFSKVKQVSPISRSLLLQDCRFVLRLGHRYVRMSSAFFESS